MIESPVREPEHVARHSTTIASRLRAQRSWALPALAALVGLIVALTGMFHPTPDATGVPPGYAALVNDKGILRSDYKSQTVASAGKAFEKTTAAERSKTLDDMIDEELLVQRGMVLDLPETTTEVREVMVAAVNAQIDAGVKGRRPTDAELRGFYDAHRADYATLGIMNVRDLVLRVGGYEALDQSTAQAETDAAAAVYQLRSGVAVERVMEHFGLVDSGPPNQETLDPAARVYLGPRLFEIAGALADGEVSDPISDANGVHILLMNHREPPRVADFGSVRAKVYGDYQNAAAKRAQRDALSILRKDARILAASEMAP